MLITDRATARRPLLEAVEAALTGGVDAVQLRDKDLSGAELYHLGRELSALARHHGASFYVNDRVDLALALRAHGVQLGAASLPIHEARRLLPPECRVGYSAHSAAEAEGAVLSGADFVLLAPIHAPRSKPAITGTMPLGPDVLWSIAAAVPIPVYALGGMDAERTRQVMTPPDGAGRAPAGVAVIGAILSVDDPGAAARGLITAMGTRP